MQVYFTVKQQFVFFFLLEKKEVCLNLYNSRAQDILPSFKILSL